MDMSDVRVAFGPDDLNKVGRFRYSVYVQEQGKNAKHVDPSQGTLIEPADRRAGSTVFWIEREGEIVGTVRAEILSPDHEDRDQLQLRSLDFIPPTKIIYFTRLMVAPAFRRTDVTPKLCFLGFQKGLVKECFLGILTCQPKLVPLFEAFGYTPYAEAFDHPESGLQIPMAIVGEVDYLRTRGAPLVDWLAQYRSLSPYTAPFLAKVSNRASPSVVPPASALIA